MIRLRSLATDVARRRFRSCCSNTPSPVAAAAARAPQLLLAPPLPSSTFSSLVRFKSSNAPVERQLSIEEQYSRKTPVEHVLLRPGMYVGPTERLPPTTCWVPALPDVRVDPSSTSTSEQSSEDELTRIRMVQRDCSLVPALNKVFDEILVNASDNRLRHKSCTRVDVTIDPGCAEGADRRPPLISV